MIPSPNAYYTAEEAKLHGAQPRVLLSLYPRNFPTGIPDEEGVFTDCALVAPERVEVDAGTPATATWVSANKQAVADSFPQTVEVSWLENLVDYTVEVEIKTATSEGGLAGASYSTVTQGGSFTLYEWYKIQVTFTELGTPTPDAYIDNVVIEDDDTPPNSYYTGLESEAGTFTNCTYAAGKVTVDTDVEEASWVGPALYNGQGGSHTETITWDDEPGSHRMRVYYRKHQWSWKIDTAAWYELADGGTFDIPAYYTYQLRVTWQLLVTDDTTYIDRLRLGAEIEIDPADVDMDGLGLPSLDAPVDFSDLVAGEFTAVLFDPDGKYDPKSASFLLADEGDLWFGKSIRVRFGFQRTGTEIVDSWLLFEGVILRWGPRTTEDGVGAIPRVEIYAQDAISQMFLQPIAPTDADGVVQPVVYGNALLLEATEQSNDNFDPVVASTGFETGDTSELTATATAGNGAVAVSTDEAYTGTYSLETKIDPAGASDEATGRLSVGGNSTTFQFKGRMKVTVMPDPPSATGTRILAALKADGTIVWELYVDSDARLYVKKSSTYWDTDVFLTAYYGRWVDIGFGWVDSTSDLFVVWLDGNEILRIEDASLANSIDRVSVGPLTGVTAEAWTIYWDDLKVWDSFYPLVLYSEGGPFEAITSVYIDGVATVAAVKKRSKRQRRLDKKFKRKYKRGKLASKSSYTEEPTWGGINWTAWTSPPSGEVMLLVAKNDIVHPVNIIREMLIGWGMEANLDEASFTAAKDLIPGMAVGCYFDEGSRADAVKEICAACLLSLYREGGDIKIKAYDGSALGAADLDLTAVKRRTTQVTTDLTELIPKVRGIWGWYDRNKDLIYEVQDDELQALLGDDEEEIDLSYGNTVVCGDAETVKTLVDALALRLSRPREVLEVEAYLEAARLELFDVVTLDGGAVKYQVFGKAIDPQAKTVSLKLVRFIGLET